MFRRPNCFLLSTAATATATTVVSSSSSIPSPYVPKSILGRNWTSKTASTSSNHARSTAEKLHQHQMSRFFGDSGSTSNSSSTAAKNIKMQQQEQQQSSSSSTGNKYSKASYVAQATNTFRETEAAVHHYESVIKPKHGYYHLPTLDYSIADGIAPVISRTQAEILREVHHRGIVDELNRLTFGTIYEGHPLDAVILHTSFDAENAAIHTCACEHWNHSFAWKSMLPFGSAPSAKFREALTTSAVKQLSAAVPVDAKTDGAQERSLAMSNILAIATPGNNGLEKVKKMLSDACRDAYASGGGWVFLVATEGGLNMEVARYRPGACPITSHLMPLVCINMQLHARIVDYTDDATVSAYIEKSMQVINWKLAEKNWLKCIHGEE